MGKLYDDLQRRAAAKRGSKAATRPALVKASPKIEVTEVVDEPVVHAEPDAPAVDAGGGIVRLIFPVSRVFVGRLDEEWHRRKLASRSETIRVLLEEVLGEEGR